MGTMNQNLIIVALYNILYGGIQRRLDMHINQTNVSRKMYRTYGRYPSLTPDMCLIKGVAVGKELGEPR